MTITRRGFLAVAATPSLLAHADDEVAIIDTHTHFYDPTRKEGVPWPGKDDKVLYRPVLPGEFKKLVRPHGVTGTVVVEASPWPKDNDWLLTLAKEEPFIKGVVGRLFPVPGTEPKSDAAESFEKQLVRYASNELYRGFRIPASELKIAFETKGFSANVARMIEANMTLDVNGGPDCIADVSRLAKEFPKLQIVLNHMGNVAIDGKNPPEAWKKDILSLGKHKNVWCKMSALVEGSRQRDGKAPKDLDFYRPTLEVLWTAFGEDRLVYGSNWPVSDLFASYATVFELALAFVTGHGKTAYRKVMGENAIAAYRLKRK